MTRSAGFFMALAALLSIACTGALDDPPAGPRNDPRVPPDTTPLPPFSPADSGLRRLTAVQYENSIRDLLGGDVDVRESISADLVSEEGFELSEVIAHDVTSSDLDVERYDIAARTAAEVVFGDVARREAFVGCAPASATDACIETFLRTFLRRAWRRPVAEEEVARYAALAATGATELGGVWLGIRYAVATALQSPFFLYRVEIGRDGLFDDYELASRLSYLLWDTTPDDELLDAAERGELSTEEGLARQTDRLLASERAQAPIMRFFEEWLGLDGLDRISKNPDVFPAYRDSFGPSMRRELELLIEQVVFTEDASVLSLFDIDHTFVNADLAQIYGIPAEALGGSVDLIEQWEAEALSPGGCVEVPGYANICSATVLAHDVAVEAGLHRFSARVYGAQAGPELVQMRMLIDGMDAGVFEIASTESAPEIVTIERELTAGNHTFAVEFLNDYYMLPDNRDLRVDWFRIEALGLSGTEFVEVPLPPERRGLMTLAGPLALYARPIDTSPTQRGLFVRERLLCEHIPPPPPGVDPSLPADPPGEMITNRQRVALHLSDETCAGCHNAMDPLGLPLEHFDGIGMYRETDRGLALDVSGNLDGTSFEGALELADLLANDRRVQDCFARLVYRRTSGRHETRAQLAEVFEVSSEWGASGHSLRALTRAIVLSEAFRSAGEPQ
ncbi:MAG: DUF1592 domain-containing protein [Myxococcota bacterium]|nr:DUF1592 domain-containing protein [Myxococcota bacterium]